jgi:NADH:ubiquinone oxidoreductase subunit 5 (subunit L)/multisubunit Na+/H+ antiporter MnhA subunit
MASRASNSPLMTRIRTRRTMRPRRTQRTRRTKRTKRTQRTKRTLLAIGSVVAGFIGIPHALGGHNVLGEWLAPVVGEHGPAEAGARTIESMTLAGDCVVTADPAAAQLPGMTTDNCVPATVAGDVALAAAVVPVGAASAVGAVTTAALQPAATGAAVESAQAEDEHAKEVLELQLMALSSALALFGVGLAWFIWLRRPEIANRMADRFPGLHRLLLNKYYVDELYDVTIVQPVKIVSEDGLWRGMDARLVDGAVNGTGQIVGGLSAVLRLFQSGSVKAYAAWTFMGAVLILAYYIWR